MGKSPVWNHFFVPHIFAFSVLLRLTQSPCHLVTIAVPECLVAFLLLLDLLLPRRKLQGANAKAYCIPLVQVFKLFQYKLYELVVILFGH